MFLVAIIVATVVVLVFFKYWYCCFLVCLFVSWFPYVSVICFLVSLVSYFFVIAASGREGLALSSFCLVSFFLLFFSRGKGYFNFLMGRVRNSSSAGQSMIYVSILEAYNSFVGRWESLDVSKKSFIIVYIPNIFFY